MINITDNAVTITAGGTKLVQEMHPETGGKFASEAECFAWVAESGWFERCKIEAIRLLKEHTSRQIERQVPAFKQINAALGVYSRRERRRIKQTLASLRQELSRKEQALLNVATLVEFQRLLALHRPSHHRLYAHQPETTAPT